MMENEDWLEVWESSHTAFNRLIPCPHLIKYYPTLKLGRDARVFVPLCGKSVDLIWLAQQGHLVIGTELSPLACEAFYREHQLPYELIDQAPFQEHRGEKIHILCGDHFQLTRERLGHIDFVYDRAALIALPPELRKKYSQQLTELLPKQAMILLQAIEYPDCSNQGPPFSVTEAEIKQLFANDYDINLLEKNKILELPEDYIKIGIKDATEVIYCLTKKD